MKYGGSGLGLFISRELTELHGGECGLSSEAKKGSKWSRSLQLANKGMSASKMGLGTFAFYVKGRRASPPTEENTKQTETQPDKVQGLKNPALLESSSQRTGHSGQSKEDSPKFDVLLVEDNLVNRRSLPLVLTPFALTMD